MSALKVYLSPLAEFKINTLLQYLESEWGNNSKKNFLGKLQSSVKRIAAFPKSCPESQEIPGVFKCVVTRQTSFYYRIQPDSIEIITVIDNRQNPGTISEEIKKTFLTQ